MFPSNLSTLIYRKSKDSQSCWVSHFKSKKCIKFSVLFLLMKITHQWFRTDGILWINKWQWHFKRYTFTWDYQHLTSNPQLKKKNAPLLSHSYQQRARVSCRDKPLLSLHRVVTKCFACSTTPWRASCSEGRNWTTWWPSRSTWAATPESSTRTWVQIPPTRPDLNPWPAQKAPPPHPLTPNGFSDWWRPVRSLDKLRDRGTTQVVLHVFAKKQNKNIQWNKTLSHRLD